MVSLKGYEVRRSSQNAKNKNEATGYVKMPKCDSGADRRAMPLTICRPDRPYSSVFRRLYGMSGLPMTTIGLCTR